MIVLGLHFGHDASVCVVRDGEVLLCVEGERRRRVKRIVSLSPGDVEACLADAGIALGDVDYCAVTSTQLVEYLFRDREKLSVRLGKHPGHDLPCTLVDRVGLDDTGMLARASGWLVRVLANGADHFYRELLPDADAILADPRNVLGSFEHFVDFPLWDRARTLGEIASTDYGPLIEGDDASHGFHYPVIVSLLGREIPGYVFSHHMAHVAYSYYVSPHRDAALLSHDGGGHGGHYGCGLFAYGRGDRIYPFAPHHLAVGEMYDLTAVKLGLGVNGGAGKLMGLSAYGRPRFYDPRFAGNWYDNGQIAPEAWMDHCIDQAKRQGYDMSLLGRRDQVTAPVNVDIAASAQRLVEDVMLKAAFSLHSAITRSTTATANLCLSGGVALNCPANSLLINKGPFATVFIPPAVNDEGLSIGAALALMHNVAGVPRPRADEISPSIAYLGQRASGDASAVARALEAFAGRVVVDALDDTARAAAAAIVRNEVIGWFEGRSEIGPRALGHRSILANPRHLENWRRANRIKGREQWRPLAPAVLKEEAHRYFSMNGKLSHFMLVNAEVTTSDLPAVTHVDGSARVQIVTPECGEFHRLLTCLNETTGLAVVLNTSFNGPGEPIVETPEDAVGFLLRTEIDALFLPGFRLTRRPE